MQIGPVQFSPSSLYVSVIQASFVGVPVIGLITIFSKTAPMSLARYRAGEFWSSSIWVRPLVYIFTTLGILVSLSITFLYGFTMKIHEANIWLSGQYLSLVLDILIVPFAKIGLTSLLVFLCCPSKIEYHPTTFSLARNRLVEKVDPEMVLKNLIRLPDEVKE